MAAGAITSEGLTLCKFRAVSEGHLLWAVSHTVFAIRAEKSVASLLHFLQEKALKVHEAPTPTSKKLIEKLTSFLE